MDIDKIQESKTKIIGKKIKYFKEINSTHIYAKENANKMENGTLIVADLQTSGIGTKGRNWYTGIGKNIAMTIFLKPNASINQLEGLTIIIANSMQKAIYDIYKYKLDIKEPNDLILNGKKISGILTQVNTIGDDIQYLLISVGFNVNEDKFSKEIQKIATSLKREYKREYSREEIISKFIEYLEEDIKNIL